METRKFVRFDKEITKIIKGFAIIFMMLLHCYSKDNYDINIDFNNYMIGNFHGSFKICVAIFTFMIGYGYAFSLQKDMKYALQHIKKLFIPFWTIVFVFTLPLCFNIIPNTEIYAIAYSLIGIYPTFNINSWFVYFFIFAMIVLPFISRFINKRPVINSLIVVIASFCIEVLIHETPRIVALFNVAIPKITETTLPLAIFNCFNLTPIMALGYLFAYKGYYERFNISRISSIWCFIICMSIIVGIITVLRPFTYNVHNPFNMDFFYAPLVIGAIVILFNKFRWPYLRKVMVSLGEVSVYMWFFHSLFYTKAVRWFYQPAITIFNDINSVVLWTIIITFLASWLIKSIVDTITN